MEFAKYVQGSVSHRINGHCVKIGETVMKRLPRPRFILVWKSEFTTYNKSTANIALRIFSSQSDHDCFVPDLSISQFESDWNRLIEAEIKSDWSDC